MSHSDVVARQNAAASKYPSPILRRPVIAVDLDNTCFDYTGALRVFAAEWIRMNQPGRSRITADMLVPFPSWDAPEWGITSAEFYRVERFAIDNGMFSLLDPMPGAASALHEIAEAGYEIRYLTGRRNDSQIPEATHEALLEHGFPDGPVLFISRHFGNASKSMVHADLFIEDNPRNIEEFAALDLPHIVFDRVYNRHLNTKHRVVDWTEMLEEVGYVIGPVVIPPDPSFRRDDVRIQCTEITDRLDVVMQRIADLTANPPPGARGRTRSVERRMHTDRLNLLENEKLRLEKQLEHAVVRLQGLDRQILIRDAFLARNPEFIQTPTEREVERKAEKLRVQTEQTHTLARRLENERSYLVEFEQELLAREERLRDAEAALDIERRTLGLPVRDEPIAFEEHPIPTVYAFYGNDPAISSILGNVCAPRVAEDRVRRRGYDIIGKCVTAAVDHETTTDIDLLAMRNGIEGAELSRACNNLRAERDALPEGSDRRHAIAQQLQEYERRLYLCVEVKWGGGSLSRAQRNLYERLRVGESIRIIAELDDRGLKSGIMRNIPFAAEPLVVRVGPKSWTAEQDARRLEAERLASAPESAVPAPVLALELQPPFQRPNHPTNS